MMPARRRFPVLGTRPREFIEWPDELERAAAINHDQTLVRLAARGGLDWYELEALVRIQDGWRRTSCDDGLSEAQARERVLEVLVLAALPDEDGAA